MLKQRLITVAVLAPLVISAILFLPSLWLGMFLAVSVLIGAWEWAGLQKYSSPVARGGFTLLIGALLYISYDLLFGGLQHYLLYVLGVAFVWWCFTFIMVASYKGQTDISTAQRVSGMFIGVVVLVPAWVGLTYIHAFGDSGPYLLLFLMFLIWAADSGAYFAGRSLGKRKLVPNVSPGKTIEGVVGGLVAALAMVFVFAYFLGFGAAELVWFVPLALFVVIVSVVGDLAESLFKRRVGVKDSSNILPGHGGILDRIDSLTAAGPVFALGLYIFGGKS